ncbi:chromosomal replication initiator protein DnaA [Aerococcaceae bacterium NML190073]|nr:chromosomal replication initiator protein DnaA [Aerococcaceae bacterium NML190073]
MEKDLFWDDFTSYLKKVLPQTFDRWIPLIKPIRLDERAISLSVPNHLTKMYCQNILADYILKYSLQTYGEEYTPTFVIVPPAEELEIKSSIPPILVDDSSADYATHSDELSDNQLNPSYTFDTLVVGEGNKLANVAALAVCDRPGTVYNPLLIYGGTGLGKTHLMHAIGNEIKRKNPHAKVKYATSESFMNDFLASFQEKLEKQFRNIYRNTDVLLIDDIQFFANKGKTQEEFFHTFNELHQSGKQIVLTCDRPPRQIANLEERLVSRFNFGLTTEIWPPDLETRIAILRKKVNSDHLDIDLATLTYIANNIDTNVRELEGALTKVLAYSVTYNRDITVNLAAEALHSLVDPQGKKTLSIDEIIHEVAKFYQVSQEALKGPKRNKEFVTPRQIAMYLTRELLEISFAKIAEHFGNRNHTTVMHAYEKVAALLNEDAKTKQDVLQLKQSFIR